MIKDTKLLLFIVIPVAVVASILLGIYIESIFNC
jgi:hypothetical protein